MSDFDVAVGIDGASMNAAAAAIYQQIYPKIFQGSQNINQAGVEFTVSWDVTAPPTFDLTPPANVESLIRAHLAGWRPPPGLVLDDVVSTLTDELDGTVFQMLLPNVALTISSASGNGTDTASAVVYVQLNSAGGPLGFQVLKATATCQNPSDNWVINSLIIPQAITIANSLLAAVTLPPLTFSGITLTPPLVTIQGNQVILLANLAGGAEPTVPAGQSWPATSFFALLSDAARLAVAQSQTAGFSVTFPFQDKLNLKIATVSFSATATLSGLSLSAGAAGSTTYGFDVSLNGNVNATLKVACVPIGVNYNISANTGPSGTISLSIQGGNSVVANVTNINNFVILLTPTGSVAQKILSAIDYPITEAVLAAFSPLITQSLEGIGFTVCVVPAIPIAIEGSTVTLTPENLTLGTFSSMMSIEGSVNIA